VIVRDLGVMMTLCGIFFNLRAGARSSQGDNLRAGARGSQGSSQEDNLRAGARSSQGGSQGSSQGNSDSRGWFRGKYLPHFDDLGIVQSITFRLCDSLPVSKFEELKEELQFLPEDKREILRRKRIEDWIDAGYGCCALAQPDMAEIMEDALLYFDGNRYDIVCWCIMPNHVHVMISARYNISKIVQSWKSFTGRRAWEILPDEWLPGSSNLRAGARSSQGNNLRAGARSSQESSQGRFRAHRFWMDDYWDRYIRDENHFNKSVEYIHNNPVKAGLCEKAEDWLWSSARYWKD
jgi:putative transposase